MLKQIESWAKQAAARKAEGGGQPRLGKNNRSERSGGGGGAADRVHRDALLPVEMLMGSTSPMPAGVAQRRSKLLSMGSGSLDTFDSGGGSESREASGKHAGGAHPMHACMPLMSACWCCARRLMQLVWGVACLR